MAKLGQGVSTDSTGQPLKVGDRVLYRYFCPCGHCKACLRRQYKSCPTRQANWLVSCEVWPHFQGGFGQYFYLRPNHAVFKIGPEITDEMAAGINCAYTQVYAGLEIAQFRAGQTVVVQGAGGLGVYAWSTHFRTTIRGGSEVLSGKNGPSPCPLPRGERGFASLAPGGREGRVRGGSDHTFPNDSLR